MQPPETPVARTARVKYSLSQPLDKYHEGLGIPSAYKMMADGDDLSALGCRLASRAYQSYLAPW